MKQVTMYKCSFCNTTYSSSEDAEACEFSHVKNSKFSIGDVVLIIYSDKIFTIDSIRYDSLANVNRYSGKYKFYENTNKLMEQWVEIAEPYLRLLHNAESIYKQKKKLGEALRKLGYKFYKIEKDPVHAEFNINVPFGKHK